MAPEISCPGTEYLHFLSPMGCPTPSFSLRKETLPWKKLLGVSEISPASPEDSCLELHLDWVSQHLPRGRRTRPGREALLWPQLSFPHGHSHCPAPPTIRAALVHFLLTFTILPASCPFLSNDDNKLSCCCSQFLAYGISLGWREAEENEATANLQSSFHSQQPVWV